MRVGFQLPTTFLIHGDTFLKLDQWSAATPKFARNRRHDGGQVINLFVSVGGERTAVACDLPQLLGQMGLPDSRIAMNVEQESAPLVINRQPQVVLILSYLRVTIREDFLLPNSNEIL